MLTFDIGIINETVKQSNNQSYIDFGGDFYNDLFSPCAHKIIFPEYGWHLHGITQSGLFLAKCVSFRRMWKSFSILSLLCLQVWRQAGLHESGGEDEDLLLLHF